MTHPRPFHGVAGCSRRGFTLLEMVLVMFIVSLLVTAVFGIVNSVTQLANGMTVEQRREARIHGFIELCSRTFRNLPPSAMVRARNQQVGGRLASQLAFVGATSPISANADGVIVLETEQARDGYFTVFLREMNAEQALAWEKGDAKAGLRVPLLDQVASLEWRFLDPRNREWTSVWNDKVALPGAAQPVLMPPGSSASLRAAAPRPGIVELRLALGNGEAERHVFWVPAAQTARPLATSPRPGDGSPNPN